MRFTTTTPSAFNSKANSSTPEKNPPGVNHVSVLTSCPRARYSPCCYIILHRGAPRLDASVEELLEISEFFKAHPHGMSYFFHANAVNLEAHLNLLH